MILAFRISNLVSAKDRKPVLDMVGAMSQTIFRLTPEDELKILLATTEDARELSELLDVHVGELPDIEAILASRNDKPVVSTPMKSFIAAPTTGPAQRPTRDRFDKTLASLYDEARGTDGCIAVIMVDADRFDSLKNTAGPEAAEIALTAISRRA